MISRKSSCGEYEKIVNKSRVLCCKEKGIRVKRW